MKVGILCVPFLTCEGHLSSALTTLQSIRTLLLDGEITVRAIINRCDNAVWRNQIAASVDQCDDNSENILSLAWNRGIRELLRDGNDYVLVMNLDIVLHPLLLERLIALACMKPEGVMWSGCEVSAPDGLLKEVPGDVLENYSNYSCFLVNGRLFDLVGEFDTRFAPAYHEDADMQYRIKLAQASTYGIASARFFHSGQGTLKEILAQKDEALALQIRLAMNASMARYAEKWGGLPGHERFVTPFGEAV